MPASNSKCGAVTAKGRRCSRTIAEEPCPYHGTPPLTATVATAGDGPTGTVAATDPFDEFAKQQLVDKGVDAGDAERIVADTYGPDDHSGEAAEAARPQRPQELHDETVDSLQGVTMRLAGVYADDDRAMDAVDDALGSVRTGGRLLDEAAAIADSDPHRAAAAADDAARWVSDSARLASNAAFRIKTPEANAVAAEAKTAADLTAQYANRLRATLASDG